MDLVLFEVLTGALFLAVSAGDFHRRDPSFYPRFQEWNAETDSTARRELRDELTLDFLVLVQDRCPDAFPGEFHDKIAGTVVLRVR